MAKTKTKKKNTSLAMIGLATALSLSPLVMTTDKVSHKPKHAKASYNPYHFTTGMFRVDVGDCPPIGIGGGDTSLSLLKNRDKPPAKPYKVMTVAGIIEHNLPETEGWEIVYKKSKRANWSAENRAEVEKLEKQGVVVTGYFLNAVSEGGEMCNCGSTEFVDIHAWLVDHEPDGTTQKELKTFRDQALVAEISPRLYGEDQDLHPNYNTKVINKIAASHKRVKVSGWMTWDQEHAGHLGKTRATLWEIHPILNIKVEVSPGKWKELDSLDIENDLKPSS